MDTINRTVEVPLTLTPKEVAQLFCSMDANEQADFFNEVAKEADTWPSCNFDLQMSYVSGANNLSYEGRNIMRTIGDYSKQD